MNGQFALRPLIILVFYKVLSKELSPSISTGILDMISRVRLNKCFIPLIRSDGVTHFFSSEVELRLSSSIIKPRHIGVAT